jgi:4-amino-4-deoxy-L-arabinose transferase-like glycosyltransferase
LLAAGAYRGQEKRVALAWLGSPRIVVGLIAAYLGVHLVVRLLTEPSLGMDDAEQALFAQTWSVGYRFRQPPLFTWLALPLFAWLGPGVLALSILRYLLLGLTYVCMYGTARRWIEDPRLAALSVFSFALMYVFAYYAHHDLTHTTALGAAIALTFYAFARLVERPSTAHYALLGVAFGLGLLAKWNFVMLAAALPVTCLLWQHLRPLVLSWKTLLAAAIAAAVASPPVLWVLAHRNFGTVSGDVLSEGTTPGFLATLAEGTAQLIKASLVFPLPFLPLFLLVFGAALWRGIGQPAPDAELRPVTPGFLGALIAVSLALHWLLVPALGAVTFTERWMHPALMILPVFLFALAERGRPSPRTIGIFACLIGLVAVGALGVRIALFTLGADHCGKCRDLVRFDVLAEGLRAAGFERGTIVVPPDDLHIGGNLRAVLPGSRVLDPAYPLSIWPQPQAQGQCLVVWQPDRTDAQGVRERLEAYLHGTLGVPQDAPRERGVLHAPMAGSATRDYTLAYELLPTGPGTCH